MLSFKLPETFLNEYKKTKVIWGYEDAAGNSLGEITFLRTYSRLKPNGQKEKWWEVCRRVIEGTFSIQKDHCKTNRLPWNDNKAQKTAQEAYERLFTFKWTPPGRGLWMMGTPLVNEQLNSAALQNPLHEDTKVLTRHGWNRLGDLEGQDVELLSSTFLYGRDKQGEVTNTSKWVKGAVSFVEEQPSVEIVFNDGMGQQRSITASRNHRWFTRRAPHNGWKRVTSEEVRAGDLLPLVKPRINYLPAMSGMQHGFFFGDGSRTNGEMEQFGASTAVLARLFGDQVKYRDRRAWVGQCPLAWGHLPEGRYQSDQRYIYGFLAGYMAADGCVSAEGYCTISSARLEEIAAVRDLFMDLGIEATEPKLTSTSSNYAAERELFTIRINRFDLTEDFFLKLEHRERWLATTYGKDRTIKHARVIEVRDAGVQRVLCATVPETEQFVTENFVLTSNCAFISTADMTKNDPTYPFAFLMEASMLGIGVGFDSKGADKDFVLYDPDTARQWTYQIPDSREGWVQSVICLLESYLLPNKGIVHFDYSLIRPAGEPIKTFGGTAAGPASLKRLHRMLVQVLGNRGGQHLTTKDIADIGNLIGVCVVSGNVRRSAELFIGDIDDKDFLNLKNKGVFTRRNATSEDPEKAGWGWMSNNSVAVNVGTDYSSIVDLIATNGEPGVVWMDTSRTHGRMIDPPDNKDYRVTGYNPCAEQSLESGECCTLVETYLNRHDSEEDFKRTLKFAYLYAKTVTLLPTHWPKTNAIMQRNRRIGTSVSGMANFTDRKDMMTLRTWLNAGYGEVKKYDHIYSEWLCVRESIKTTTVKPSGTVSILAGESPGVHWAPGGEYFNRALRFATEDPILALFKQAGYRVEVDVSNPETTSVLYFPIRSLARRSEKDVSVFEKANIAVIAQRYWSDNSVSVTLSFDAETEAKHIGTLLHMHEGQLKTVSFLPQGNNTYPQMPYTEISPEEYEQATMTLFKVDLNPIYKGLGVEAVGEAFCTTDVCLVERVVDVGHHSDAV